MVLLRACCLLALVFGTAGPVYLFTYFTHNGDVYRDRPCGVMRSRDLRSWEEVTAHRVLPGAGTPDRVRHGTVITVPRALIELRLSTIPPNAPQNS
jgi:hypothetical protein